MRDRILILLSVVVFIVLLSLGATPFWSLFILLFVLLGYLGLQYPSGVSEWNTDKKESAYLIMTLAVILLIIYLVYTVFTIITFPPVVVLLAWGAGLGLAGLFILSIFYPRGLGVKM
ncbi:MAG: hypothetical protein KGY76_05350 [Candidatus Thermoplasmatota archaeon]|nr:hypothetical protein [Candidatus Thermoplasmatota archaeon]